MFITILNNSKPKKDRGTQCLVCVEKKLTRAFVKDTAVLLLKVSRDYVVSLLDENLSGKGTIWNIWRNCETYM